MIAHRSTSIRSLARALSLLYLVNFRHTLRSDHRDEMAQLVFDIARCCNCVRDFPVPDCGNCLN